MASSYFGGADFSLIHLKFCVCGVVLAGLGVTRLGINNPAGFSYHRPFTCFMLQRQGSNVLKGHGDRDRGLQET